jgi:NADP-dependent 3-hydroxy acid dehydrogenase YdfG
MGTLTDRTALVTGATSGIGAATARALHAEGAHLVLAARRRERLEAMARELDGSELVEVDVRDWRAVAAAVGGLEIDVCVANAGLGLGLEPIQAGDPDDWAAMLDTNVKGLLHTVRATLPGMIERGSGDVVLIGSVAGRQVYPGGNVYCASKWAVRGIYEALRIDVPQPEIRITTVDPGMVKTDFSRVRFKGDEGKAAKVYEGVDHLNPEDVADVVRYVVTRPRHVNIGEVVLWASAQASTSQLTRKGT